MTAVKDIQRSDDTDLRKAAVDRLKKQQDFRGHLLIYALVNAVVWGIWTVTSARGFPWPVFVTAGWGIGVIMNAWDVYGRKPITEAQVQHEVDRLRHDP
jgi:hypothetical protein